MFEQKKTSLFAQGAKSKTSGGVAATASPFVKAGLKAAARTTSLGNGAVKFTTTGNDFVDQFGKITNYKAPRPYKEVADDMGLLWSQNPWLTMCLLFYIRIVTRVVSFFDGTKSTVSQRGQGLKHEGIMRMIWVGINYPETFQKNLGLYISAGGWKDVFTMLQYDLIYNGWDKRALDWDFIGKFILAGLENPNVNSLVKKYLPQIKTNSVCKSVESQADNIIAKWICSLLYGNKQSASEYKKYRKLKTSGTAHEWQKLISQGKMLSINFNTVAGRALSQLVSGKFLANNKLEADYEKWLSTKPIAKYTGYAYELLAPVKKGYSNNSLKKYQEETINKQFMGLIEIGKNGLKEGESGLLVVVDSSSSMTSSVPGTKTSAYNIAMSMALYFSYLLKGKFEGAWMEFNDSAQLKTWKGATPVERIHNDRSKAYGSTNFQSVAKVFINVLNSGVPESDFPSGILCVSDGCFNSSGSNETETKVLKKNLLRAGFSKAYVDNFKIVLWDIPNGHYGGSQTAFEDSADCPNLFHMSGLDGAGIAFLTGVKGQTSIPKTSEELFKAAMDQELLNLITV